MANYLTYRPTIIVEEDSFTRLCIEGIVKPSGASRKMARQSEKFARQIKKLREGNFWAKLWWILR